jgi:hypothetical protein
MATPRLKEATDMHMKQTTTSTALLRLVPLKGRRLLAEGGVSWTKPPLLLRVWLRRVRCA